MIDFEMVQKRIVQLAVLSVSAEFVQTTSYHSLPYLLGVSFP